MKRLFAIPVLAVALTVVGLTASPAAAAPSGCYEWMGHWAIVGWNGWTAIVRWVMPC